MKAWATPIHSVLRDLKKSATSGRSEPLQNSPPRNCKAGFTFYAKQAILKMQS